MLNKNRIIGKWLLLGVIMLMVQVLLGGITRLTGSGLSMTDWKPIIGMIPPLNEAEWNIAFEKYKQIGQFKFLNQDYVLSDFKFIFFWEWFHRNWAHFIAFTFLIPFIYFLYKKMITKEMIPKLIALFLLGIAQGLIGWIMVKSGLNEENLYVNHIKLAIHFISAMVLIVFTYWFALGFLVDEQQKLNQPNLYKFSVGLLGLVAIQLIYGAFMAGLKAATAAPTWPSINGDYFPDSLRLQSLVHHPINIHFVHRMIAYLLAAIICIWFFKARKVNSSLLFSKYRWVPLALVFIQIILGILSVLNATKLTRNGLGVFEYLALFHQIVAMCLVMSLVWVIYIFKTSSQKPITINR